MLEVKGVDTYSRKTKKNLKDVLKALDDKNIKYSIEVGYNSEWVLLDKFAIYVHEKIDLHPKLKDGRKL